MARHIESADLPEDIARLAEAQVAAGRFATVEDVVRGVFEGDAFASVRAELYSMNRPSTAKP